MFDSLEAFLEIVFGGGYCGTVIVIMLYCFFPNVFMRWYRRLLSLLPNNRGSQRKKRALNPDQSHRAGNGHNPNG